MCNSTDLPYCYFYFRKDLMCLENKDRENKKSFMSFFNRKKKPKVYKETVNLLPFSHIEGDYIVLSDGSYLEILQIETTDLNSKNEDELQQLLYPRTGFMRSYNNSFKEVAMNFPVDASLQRKYWMKKLKVTNDPVKLQIIERNLHAFDFIEKERTNREFFMFIYAETKGSLASLISQTIRMNQFSFPMHEITLQKKKDVLFLLNNSNTKLARE